jgi:hypothetical protein
MKYYDFDCMISIDIIDRNRTIMRQVCRGTANAVPIFLQQINKAIIIWRIT